MVTIHFFRASQHYSFRFPSAKAGTNGGDDGEEEGDVPDGDDDEGEDVGVVVAERRLRGVVVCRRNPVDVTTSGDQPTRAKIIRF
jgi:hypothetical protein